MGYHQTFAANETGRDFVLGDLHGMYQQLTEAMAKVQFDPDKDRMFSVGDLIDRGPDSIKCLKLLNESWFASVQGNHERMMIYALKYADSNMYSMWLMNGGSWSLDADEQEVQSWLDSLDNLPLTLTIEQPDGQRVGICHAEFPLDSWNQRDEATHPSDKSSAPLLWGRDQIRHKKERTIADVSRVYLGHTPVDHITVLGNCWFIDTGCFQTDRLTLLEIQL